MGLLDYYRQFQDMADEEISAELRARAEERRRRALARIEALDLSGTTWHEMPHPDVVAAITYVARRGINRASDPLALELRGELARRHDVRSDQVAVGAGASALLASAAAALLGPEDELVTPWPSYPLYPLMARAAGAGAVPVPGPEQVLDAIGPRTRVVAICNPNDPTGEHLRTEEIDRLLGALPEQVVLLLDEALTDFVDAEPPNASLELLDRHPRLLVFRTFSKAYGLAGLRCGFVLAGPGAEGLLERIRPPLGLGDVVQAGALEALRKCAPLVAMRRDAVAAERRRLLDELGDLGVEARPSQANFLWLRAPGLAAEELRTRLRAQAVLVHPGSEVGDAEHVRAAVQSRAAGDRLLTGLRAALGR